MDSQADFQQKVLDSLNSLDNTQKLILQNDNPIKASPPRPEPLLTDWLIAIGTIGAVVTSLWLAQRKTKPKLKIISCYSTMLLDENIYRTGNYVFPNVVLVDDDSIAQLYTLRIGNFGQTIMNVGQFAILNHKDKTYGMWPKFVDFHSAEIMPGRYHDFAIPMDHLLANIFDETWFNPNKRLCFRIVDDLGREYKFYGNKPKDFRNPLSLNKFNALMKSKNLLKTDVENISS